MLNIKHPTLLKSDSSFSELIKFGILEIHTKILHALTQYQSPGCVQGDFLHKIPTD